MKRIRHLEQSSLSAGFSLVEAMVVLAVLAVASIAISQVILNFAQQQKVIDSKATFLQLSNSIISTAGQTSTLITSEDIYD